MVGKALRAISRTLRHERELYSDRQMQSGSDVSDSVPFKELVIPELVSPSSGGVNRESSKITYSTRLTSPLERSRTYWEANSQFLENSRIADAAEELSIQMHLEGLGKNLEEQPEYADAFGKIPDPELRNSNPMLGNYSILQITATVLRVPRGWENGRYQSDSKGNRYLPRKVLINMEECGEIMIPASPGWSPVMEIDPVFGIPLAVGVRGIDRSKMYFMLADPNPPVDSITEERDVVVVRGSEPFNHHIYLGYKIPEKGLSIYAIDRGLLKENTYAGVRPVIGPFIYPRKA